MTQHGRRKREAGSLRDPETGAWNWSEIFYYGRGWIAVAIALAVVLGGGLYFGGKAWNKFMEVRTAEDYLGAEGVADVSITIPHGSNMTTVGKILEEQDVIKSADTFRKYSLTRPDDVKKMQAGRYKMRTQVSSQAAFDRLMDPTNRSRTLMTLREGNRMSEQLAEMAQASEVPLADFEAAVAAPDSLGLPSWAQGRPEGFFFPETYELPADPTATDVIKVTTTQFAKVMEDLNFVERAASSPAGDAYTALVMASIVEREANRDEDRLKVARVFYNRLAKGRPMQSDATVAYANNVTGRVTTTERERQLDSPYNLYLDKNAGKLTPTPITSPSRSAMEAAIDPAEGNWEYFVTVNLDTGETEFNDTYDGHLASVNKFRAFCQTSDKC